MAISYFRHQQVQRTNSDCAVRKSAYYSRESLYFEGSCALEAQTFDYSDRKGDLTYHNVLLPEGADKRFKDIQYLWNEAAKAEKRVNAREAQEGVLALPKESTFSHEDLVEFAEDFAKKHFSSKGLITQVNIHWKDGNPHAHYLIATRYLDKTGRFFGEKARELNEEIFRKRWPVETKSFFDGKFKAMGLDLRCDPPGIVAQKHLGLKGTWGRAFDLHLENQERIELNAELAKDPQQILQAITKYQSVFSPDDVERFVDKHTPEDFIETVKEAFWKQEEIIQMLDKKTGEKMDLFSIQEVVCEENHLAKLGDILLSRKSKFLPIVAPTRLNDEQRKAFYSLMKGEGLMTLQGFAGTGKSYVLEAVAKAYEEGGKEVYALGADNAAASALQDKGLAAQNVYRFLYRDHFAQEDMKKGSVIILDEAGKLGNGPLTELLKFAARKKATLILAGDSAQFSPVERGGAFRHFCEKTQGPTLTNIQRQQDRESIEIAKAIAKGNTDFAIDRLIERKQIHFSDTRSEAMSLLGKQWASDHALGGNNHEDSIIIAATNKEAHTLNEMIRHTRIQWGEIDALEVGVKTTYGQLFFAKGDLIAFRGNDREIGVENGMRGTIVATEEDLLSVEIKEDNTKTRLVHFNPKEYRKFHHGYAINANLSQGGTWKRTYFLHAPHLNLQMLYVAASRHIEKFLYFVAKTDAPSLAAFKAQARRDGSKATTLECDNSPTIGMKAQEEQKIQEIDQLKTSERLKDNFVGYFKGATHFFKEKIETRVLKQKDPEFYNHHSSIQVHPNDQSHKVNTKKTIEAMAAQKEFVYSLPGEILNQTNADILFKGFLENNKIASEKRELAEQEAETLGIPIEKTPSFKELGENTSKRNAIAKAFVEKAKWDDLSIHNTYGADVERLFLLNAKKFDQSFSVTRLKSKRSDALFELWKERYANSREHLKTVRLESIALRKDESTHPSSAESLLAAKEANWIAWGEVHRLSGKKEGIPVLNEENKKLFSEEALIALEKGSESFEKSLQPVEVFEQEKLKESLQGSLFQSEKLERLHFSEMRYKAVCDKISSIEREVGVEVSKCCTLPNKCPSYEKLTPELFSQRKALAAHLIESLAKNKIPGEEVCNKDLWKKLCYQAASFEAKFEVNKTPYKGKPLQEIEPLKEKYINAQEKSFGLWRPLEIEAALNEKKASELSGFFEAMEAKSILETMAFVLKDKIKNMDKDPQDLLHESVLKAAERFEAKFEVNKTPYKGKPLQEIEPLKEKYIAAQEKSFGLWRSLKIEAALNEKKVSELSGFFEAMEAKSILETMAFVLKDKIKNMDKDPQELLHESVLKAAERFEGKSQIPLFSFEAQGKLKKLGDLYAQGELQEKVALLNCRKEQVEEAKPLEECKFSELYFSARASKKSLAFALLQEEKNLETSPIQEEKRGILEKEAQRFSKTLEVDPFLQEKGRKPSPQLDKLLSKYQETLEKIAELRKENALEGRDTSESKELAIHYGARNNLAAQITGQCQEESTSLTSYVKESPAKKIVNEGEKFKSRFEEIALFEEKTSDKDLLHYQALVKEALQLQKITLEEATREGIRAEKTEFFKEKTEALSARNKKAWTIEMISPEKKRYFSKEGLEKFKSHAERFEKSFDPSTIWEKEKGPDSFKALIDGWDQSRQAVLRERKELILLELDGTKINPKRYRFLGDLANNRNEKAHAISLFLKEQKTELDQSGLTLATQGEILSNEKTFFNKLEAGKATLEGELFLPKENISKELQSALESFEKIYKLAGEKKGIALQEAKTSTSKIFQTEEWQDYSLVRKKRNELAIQLRTLAEKEETPLSTVFTPGGKVVFQSAINDFEKKFAFKNPLEKESNHPLIREYCRLGEELAKARKEYTIDRIDSKEFPKESYSQVQGLLLQKDLLSKTLCNSLGEDKVYETFKTKNAEEIIAQKERVEGLIPSKNQEAPEQKESFKNTRSAKWICLKPPPNAPTPKTRQLGDSVETARYPYKNSKGEILHYVLRLEDKEGNKITPPLSYGYDPQRSENPHWKMKGFDHGEEKRTLYNLDRLAKNPLAPVIVVEGEKTADAAPFKLKGEFKNKEIIAVTWQGGCKAASKTDWTPLAGRDVLIWPDNDKGGFQAAKEIESELFRVGAKEIKTVDREWLSKTFEEKWDLADPWPKSLKSKDLKQKTRGVLCSKSRDSFLILSHDKNLKFEAKLALGDIVSAYKEGRNLGECAFGETSQDQLTILRKIGRGPLNIFKKEDEVFKRLGEDPHINASGDLQKHLTRQCSLFEARHGLEPSLSEINLMKETIQESEKSLSGNSLPKMLKSELQCTKQRTFEKLCKESFRGKEMASNSQEVQNVFEIEAKELSFAKVQEKEISKNLEQAQKLEKSLSHDWGR